MAVTEISLDDVGNFIFYDFGIVTDQGRYRLILTLTEEGRHVLNRLIPLLPPVYINAGWRIAVAELNR